MDISYQRKLIMLQGPGGLTGFVNLEERGGKLSLKFQAVGLERGANDAHGQILSLKKKRKLDCGRFRVDTRGQGGLLRSFEPSEMDGMTIRDLDTVSVTAGEHAVLAGSIAGGRVDWDALRKVLSPSKATALPDAHDHAPGIHAVEPIAPAARAQAIVYQMQPNQSESLITSPETHAPAEAVKKDIYVEAASLSPAVNADKPHAETNEIERLISLLSAQKPEILNAIVKIFGDKKAADDDSAAPRAILADETPASSADLSEETLLISDSPRAIIDDSPTAADSAPGLTAWAEEPDYIDIASTPQELSRHAPATAIDPIYYTQAEYSGETESTATPLLQTPDDPQEVSSSSTSGVWPVWSAYRKPALFWPEETEDLREMFERGAPDETVHMPGWLFVKTPTVVEGFDSLLGVYAQGGQVTQSALILKGDNTPEPPAGLTGYEYTNDLVGGCWVQWRDYTMLYMKAE